jgi:hypothetical protein
MEGVLANVWQSFKSLLQVRYGRAEQRTPMGAFNSAIDPKREIRQATDIESHRRLYTGPMFSQRRLGEIRWGRAVENSKRKRNMPL